MIRVRRKEARVKSPRQAQGQPGAGGGRGGVPAPPEGVAKAVLAFCRSPLVGAPKAETPETQTPMIRASTTAYSTAVGPSSRARERHTDGHKPRIPCLLCNGT